MINKTCNLGNRGSNTGGQVFSALKSNQFQIERGGGKLQEVDSLEKQKELDRLCGQEASFFLQLLMAEPASPHFLLLHHEGLLLWPGGPQASLLESTNTLPTKVNSTLGQGWAA